MPRLPSSRRPWPARSSPQRQPQQQPSAAGVTIPRVMSFLLPAGEPLAFLEFLSIQSFAKLHPSWRVRAYRCPSYCRPRCHPTSFTIPLSHLPADPLPVAYTGPDHWPDLPSLGVSTIDCDAASEAADLTTLAAAGGFISPPSILWLSAAALDSLHSMARGLPLIVCREPHELAPAMSLVGAPPNSPLFADLVQYIIAGCDDTAGVFSQPRKVEKRIELPPHTFCPWPPEADCFQIWGQYNRELPRSTIGLNWRLSSPATEFFRRVVVDERAIAGMRDCTFRYFAMRVLSATRRMATGD